MRSLNRKMVAFAALLVWLFVGLSGGPAAAQADREVPAPRSSRKASVPWATKLVVAARKSISRPRS